MRHMTEQIILVVVTILIVFILMCGILLPNYNPIIKNILTILFLNPITLIILILLIYLTVDGYLERIR